MKQFINTLIDNITEFFSADKHHILDSYFAGITMAALLNFLEGSMKFFGGMLTILLFIRAGYGIYKDRLDARSKKLDILLKEKQLKNEKLVKENIS